MFSLSSSGSFKTETWLGKVRRDGLYPSLEALAQRGVNALAAATPSNTGKTASSWYYHIERSGNKTTIEWRNSNLAGDTGTPVAILLQYGHGTGTGGYVQGHDFINPAIKPIMDQIASDVWKVVTS